MWSTGKGNGNPLQYSCLETPMNSVKRQQSVGPQRVGHNLATEQQQSEYRTQFLKKHFLFFLQKYNGNIQITRSYCFLNSFTEVLLYSPSLTFMHDYWKNHSFDQVDLCLLFIIASLPRSKYLLISWTISMEYYSTLNRDELSIHENTWRKLKCIL